MQEWPLRQIDINNAFLYEKLNETIYMMQLLAFKDPAYHNHICKSNKAIYDLKQAPKTWYSALKEAIMALRLKDFKANSYLFIYNNYSVLCYLLVYVDDLIITDNELKFLNHIIAQLGTGFSLKDMGSLYFFLGIEVIPIKFGLFFSQHKYIRDLLSLTNITGTKQVFIVLPTSTSLKLVDGTTLFDSLEFKSVIGGLQCLSLTHPNICFTI